MVGKIRNRRKKGIFLIFFLCIAVTAVIIYFITAVNPAIKEKRFMKYLQNVEVEDYVDVQLLSKDSTSREGIMLDGVKNIVVHYVGNPGTTAQQNRNYFAKDGTEVNSHFVIGLEGEIIQCIPLYEKSSASNWRNKDTISIEVCHPDDSGKFNNTTMKSLIKLTSWLCDVCNLNEKDVIRHYDITGKECPLYYVKHEDAWKSFLSNVKNTLDEKN